MEEKLTFICSLSDFTDGIDFKAYTINSNPILVVKKDNQFFILNSTCPHLGGNLSEGTFSEDMQFVECPWHQAKIEVSTGKVVSPPKITGIKTINNLVKQFLPPCVIYKPIVKDNNLYISGETMKQSVKFQH